MASNNEPQDIDVDFKSIKNAAREKWKRASKIFTNMGKEMGDYYNFIKGKDSLQEWIEQNRILRGKPFSYENAEVEMLLGEMDKKLDKAPRPYLTQYINDRSKDKSTIKCRQCLPWDSVILIEWLDKFTWCRIKDLWKIKYRGNIVFNKNGNYKIAKVVDIWKSGKKEILEIRTKSGHKLLCSNKEKVWVKKTHDENKENQFYLAEELIIGDYLDIYKDDFGLIDNEKLAINAGYFYGDGSSFINCNNRKIMVFRNRNKKYIDEFVGNSDHCRRYEVKSKRDGNKRLWDVFLRQDDHLRKKFEEWNIFGLKGTERLISNELMSMNKECTALFINRLFSADGWFKYKLRNKHNTYLFNCGIAQPNIEVLNQLQILLNRFKINSVIKRFFSKRHTIPMWKLMISAKHSNMLKFVKEIGIYDKINNKDIKLLEGIVYNDNLYSNRSEHHQAFKYNQIVSIRKLKPEMTYDLSISDKEHHNLYANGILVSNSEFTENEVNENIYLCATRPYTNISHIFPTSGMGWKMAREKISPAIERSPSISKLIKRPYNLVSKAFSNGSFYTIDSSWTDYQGRGPSRDKITFDEYESQNPQIEDIYSESTSHSALGRKTRISTPKFPDSGIDEKFKRGCMYEWHIICPKCKKEQIITFPENIINFFESDNIDTDSEAYESKLNKVYIGCKYCKAYLDKTSFHYLKTSRWIAAKPHLVGIRTSYRVTYMMLPWKTGKEILYKYHTFRFVHQFWNEVVGFAYISPEARVSREIFEQCQDKSFLCQYSRLGMAKKVSIGVDWGEVSWAVVRANGFAPNTLLPRIIYVEKIDKESLIKHGFTGLQTDHAKRVAQMAIFFKTNIIINDANGIGVDRNSYLKRKFPTRSWGCFYDTAEIQKQKKKAKLIDPVWQRGRKTVTVSRVGTFKLMIQEYEDKMVTIPRLDPTMEEFVQHHANLAIERYVDETTEALYEVVGHTGPDHLAHADNYSKIGFDKLVNIYVKRAGGVINKSDSRIPDPGEEIHPLLKKR